MRRDEPNRHGRAADALIASYVRELLADDGPRADSARLPTPIAANREVQGVPLGAQMQPTEAGIQCALE
ncbi:MAG: hypothetical protein ACTHOE_04230 [Conexibacter sp.]